jgi:hypothetical protein
MPNSLTPPTSKPFAEQNAALFDKKLLTRFYRSSTLASDAARTGWVEPDLQTLPFSASMNGRCLPVSFTRRKPWPLEDGHVLGQSSVLSRLPGQAATTCSPVPHGTKST